MSGLIVSTNDTRCNTNLLLATRNCFLITGIVMPKLPS